jgi:hypothetical protein
MPSQNLPLPTQLSISTSYIQSGRTRLIDFGDGYVQRTPLGINNKIRYVIVVHENLSPTDAATVLTVYDSVQASGDPIDITANELLTTDGLFYIEDVSVDMADNDRRTITATMREVFDL